jgi:hypothetical protein
MKKRSNSQIAKSQTEISPEAELPDMESVNEREHPEPTAPEQLAPRHNNQGAKTLEPAEGDVQTVEEAIRFQVKKTNAA